MDACFVSGIFPEGIAGANRAGSNSSSISCSGSKYSIPVIAVSFALKSLIFLPISINSPYRTLWDALDAPLDICLNSLIYYRVDFPLPKILCRRPPVRPENLYGARFTVHLAVQIRYFHDVTHFQVFDPSLAAEIVYGNAEDSLRWQTKGQTVKVVIYLDFSDRACTIRNVYFESGALPLFFEVVDYFQNLLGISCDTHYARMSKDLL